MTSAILQPILPTIEQKYTTLCNTIRVSETNREDHGGRPRPNTTVMSRSSGWKGKRTRLVVDRALTLVAAVVAVKVDDDVLLVAGLLALARHGGSQGSGMENSISRV